MMFPSCTCCGDGFTPCDVCSGTLTPNNQIAIEATVSITNSAGARLSAPYSCSDPKTSCSGFSAFPSYLICTRPIYSTGPPACTFLLPCYYRYMQWICGPYSLASSERIGGAIHDVLVSLQGGGSSKYWSCRIYAGDAFDYVAASLPSCQWQENVATSAYCSGDGSSFTASAVDYTSATFSSCTPAASYTLTTSASPLTKYTPWGSVTFPSSLTLYTL